MRIKNNLLEVSRIIVLVELILSFNLLFPHDPINKIGFVIYLLPVLYGSSLETIDVALNLINLIKRGK